MEKIKVWLKLSTSRIGLRRKMDRGSNCCGKASKGQLRSGSSRKSTPLKISQSSFSAMNVTSPTFCMKLWTQIFKTLKQRHKYWMTSSCTTNYCALRNDLPIQKQKSDLNDHTQNHWRQIRRVPLDDGRHKDCSGALRTRDPKRRESYNRLGAFLWGRQWRRNIRVLKIWRREGLRLKSR